MSYNRYSKFTMTNIDNNYKIMLLCGDYNDILNAGATEYELPNNIIIGDVVVKREWDKNVPFGSQIADEMNLKIDYNSLSSNGMDDLRGWINKNGTDNTSIYNGTTDELDCKRIFELNYIPNIWILLRNDVVDYIGVQIANPSNEITINNETCEREIKTISIHKFTMEKTFCQFWNEDYVSNKPHWLPVLFNSLSNLGSDWFMKIIEMYKNFNGIDRHSYNYCRDGRYGHVFGKIQDMNTVMQYGYKRIIMALVRSFKNTSFIDTIVLPNPLMQFQYYKNPNDSNSNQGLPIDIENVMINIGYTKVNQLSEQYNIPLKNQYSNLWNFAPNYYGAFAQRLVFDYSNCGFKMYPITENLTPIEILDTDFEPSNIKISILNDAYNSIQIKTPTALSSDINNFQHNIEFSDAGAKIIGTAFTNNQQNTINILDTAPEGNIKKFWNLYGDISVSEFPIYKLFYYDSSLNSVSYLKPGHIKVSNMIGYITNGTEITGTDIATDWQNINDLDSFNTAVLKLQSTSIANIVSNIYKDYFYNQNLYTIELTLSLDKFNSTMFGMQFDCNFQTIFGAITGLPAGNNWILSNIETNYTNNECKCVFFIRGDKYANS